jgi:TonB family protein
VDTTKVYPIAEEYPKYFDGLKALDKYVQTNFIYPKTAIDNEEEGTVWLKCIIHKNGKLSDISVVKSVSPSIDAEALRIIAQMKYWIPGKVSNAIVDSYYYIPVTVGLQLARQAAIISDSLIYGNIQPYDSIQEDIITNYHLEDREAHFPGGNVALNTFIKVYFEDTYIDRRDVEIEVQMKFVVNTDGSLTNFKVNRECNYFLERDVLHLLQIMPNWLPAVRNAKYVKKSYTVPLKFRITKV